MKIKKSIIFIALLVVLIPMVVFTANLISDFDTPETLAKEVDITPNYDDSRYDQIYLAGGCFWGVEAYFDKIVGIVYNDVGYANGDSDDTDYYSINKTGHTETLHVVYDKDKIDLETIIEYYFSIIDPTSVDRQGNDIGSQYRSGIYYEDESDRDVIDKVLKEVQKDYDKEIVTEVEPLRNYVLAEDYHQDYLEKNPGGYCHVSLSNIPNEKPYISKDNYAKPSDEKLKEELTQRQYEITQNNQMEEEKEGKYWDNHGKGIYVDVVTGEPLFSSEDKYDADTGYASFYRPIDEKVIKFNEDDTTQSKAEVSSRIGDTHLGYVYDDGKKEEGGIRYSINSASLKFIALDEMEKEGYEDFKIYAK